MAGVCRVALLLVLVASSSSCCAASAYLRRVRGGVKLDAMEELNSYIDEHQLVSMCQAAIKVAVSTRAKDPAKVIADALLAARTAPAPAQEAPPTFTFFKFPVDPANVFYYSEHTFAMVNLRPIKPGHLLVVPRRVVARLEELSEAEAVDLMRTVHKVVSTLKGKLGAAGFSIASQDGAAAGQTVGHVHYHVIAREESPAIVPTAGAAHVNACTRPRTRARRHARTAPPAPFIPSGTHSHPPLARRRRRDGDAQIGRAAAGPQHQDLPPDGLRREDVHGGATTGRPCERSGEPALAHDARGTLSGLRGDSGPQRRPIPGSGCSNRPGGRLH